MTTNLVLALTIGGAVRGRRLPDAVPEPDPGASSGSCWPGTAINLLLLSTGTDGVPPIVGEPSNGEPMADPIPQALILTSIVISLAVSTFLFAMAYRNYEVTQEPETRGRARNPTSSPTPRPGRGEE